MSAAPPPARIALLVHGLDEPGTIWDDLAPALDRAGLTVVRFDYPNDEHVERSARRLIAALKDLKSRGVGRVDIVAHSMGGLVSRDVLTRDDAYAGECDQPDVAELPDIHRLIMVGTPNYGSLMARLRPLAEIREQLVRWMHAGITKPGTLLGFLTDGAGEAEDDITIGSRFLNDLNARPMPRHVAITCIVGEMAPAQSNHLIDMLKTPRARRILGARAGRLARDLRAVMLELGDGVVSVSSAQLKGVTDIVRVHANHRTMLLTLDAERLLTPITGAPPADPPAIRVILDRLREASPGASPDGRRATGRPSACSSGAEI